MVRTLLFTSLFLFAFNIAAAQDSERVGPADGGQFVPTGQLVRPAGTTVAFPGRPVDLALAPDGSFLVAKDNRGLVFVDAATWKIQQELRFPAGGGASMHGIAISSDGKTVYATNAGNKLHIAQSDGSGKWAIVRSIELPGPKKGGAPYPTGLAFLDDGKRALVCLSRNNTVAVVDLAAGKVLNEIEVGVAPYAVVVGREADTAWVSNWGGRRAKAGDKTAPSSGTPTVVDERGIASTGTVGKLDLKRNTMSAEIAVGLHPAGMTLTPDGRRLLVANANSDNLAVIDTTEAKSVATLSVRPDANLPFGSLPNAVAITPDGKTLFVANGGNNAVAVVNLDREPAIAGFIPTGWFPGGVVTDGKHLFIANVKGEGSRTRDEKKEAYNSHRHRGTLSKVPVPTAEKLAEYSKQVRADSRVPQVLSHLEQARSGIKPVPVPARLGEPSVFEHVVYVIKENRTYDQIFGQLKQGNGEPKLCIFGPDITPNHHALAQEFVLLDNFYCNGVLSADGHSWVTEGIVTDHLEKSFGGFTRSYTFGDDPLTYSSAGFIWDNALLRGKSVRNYGELVYSEPTEKGVRFPEVWKDYTEKTNKIKFKHELGIEPLRQYTAPNYPGWNMNVPDVLRVDRFLDEFREAEKKGEWYNFVMVFLPQDHGSGTSPGMPTPRAHMADNDLALGRLVEAISHSKFWPKTCIFVIEDDPQDGWDHVDGHRSIGLVISPYTKRQQVISKFYNQTSVVHTMERILGLPPMNQFDGLAPLMTDCFTDKPDLTPFKARPATIPLDELNPQLANLDGKRRMWAELSLKQNLIRPDRIDDDAMNRILWHSVKGVDTPYPAEWAGAHGRGLKGLKLKHVKGD